MQLTIGQIKKHCKNHPYFALRHITGCVAGVNSAIVKRDLMNKNDDIITDYVSIIPCTLNEYINIKIKY